MSRQDELDRAAGAALRQARVEKGLSQEAASDLAGVDQSLLSKVERLGPGLIGWARFCRIAASLGMEAEVRLIPKPSD